MDAGFVAFFVRLFADFQRHQVPLHLGVLADLDGTIPLFLSVLFLLLHAAQ